MTTSTFTLDIVTPEQTLASQAVDLVEVPGGDGDFGVLPGHAPLISTIRPGVVKLYNDGKYYIQFKTENLMFKGTHPIRFENNQKDHMLMMIIESDSLYVKSRKGLTNYRKNLLLIKYLEKETY